MRNVDDKTLLDILMTYMAGNAYLRQKKANMRKEYLEMMEQIARVDPPVASGEKDAEIEREFEKMIAKKPKSSAKAASKKEDTAEDVDSDL